MPVKKSHTTTTPSNPPSQNGVPPQPAEPSPLEDIRLEEEEALRPSRTDALFDLNEFRASDDDLEEAILPVASKHIAIRKPGKQDYVSVHPNPDMSVPVVTIELATPQSRVLYVVKGKALQEELLLEYGARRQQLYLAVDILGRYFLWPVGLPRQDGTLGSWGESALMAIEAAQHSWVHVAADSARQEYMLRQLKPGKKDLPTWPDQPIEFYCQLAFRGNVLEEGHPALLRLRGEV